MKKVKISVTAKDIKAGIRCEPALCPIARAFRRCTGTHKAVEVGYGGFLFLGGSRSYLLTEKASRFVREFDDGRAVKPFTFTAIRRV